jgi:hypothetical protein
MGYPTPTFGTITSLVNEGASLIDMHTAPPSSVTATAGSALFSYYPVVGNDPGDHQLAQAFIKTTPTEVGSISEVGLAIDSKVASGYVPSWIENTAYNLNAIAQANGWVWLCTTAGTSATSGNGPSAASGTALGTTVTDGSITWTLQSHNETDFKANFFFTQEAAAGGGSAWVGSMDQVIDSGWQGQNAYTLELDQSNNRGHAAPDGNFNAANLFLYGDTQYRNTAAIDVGTPSTTPATGAHAYGILMNDGGTGTTGKLNYYADISLNTSSEVAIDINSLSGIGGARSIAGIRFNDVSPSADAIQIAGTHKNGVNINGTIEQWAFVSPGFTVDASGDVGAATINSSTGTLNANGNYGRVNLLTGNNQGWRLISNSNGSTLGSVVLQGTTDGFNSSFINAFTAGTTGQISLSSGIASTSTTTGALTVSGGVGVSGALNVGGVINGEYQPSGTGAVARQLSAKLGEFVSAKDFGATGNGTTDDTAAIKAFINYVTANGLKGFIPAGSYLISSTVSITLGSLGFEINGAGCDSAQFLAASSFTAEPVFQVVGTGTTVGWTLGGFSIAPSSGGPGSATVGLQIGSAASGSTNINGYQFSTIENVEISGFPNLYGIVHARMIKFYNCAGWNQSYASANTCVNISQNGYFTGDLVFDTCQFVSSDATSNFAVNITNTVGTYNANNGNCSICGIKFLNCDLYAGAQAVNATVQNGAYLADFWFNGVQVDQKTVNCINLIASGSGSLIQDIHIADCYFAEATTAQITIAAETAATASDIYVHHNQVIATQNNGINFYGVGGTLKNVHVNDNSFPDANTTAALIEFNTVSRFTCTGNTASGVFSSNTAAHIVQIESGCADFVVSGNIGAAYTTGSVINDLSGNVVKSITNNPGYNPIGLNTITPGASPYAYVNTSGAPQVVTVANGTVSALSMEGISITVQTDNQIVVPQGATLTVTYSSAPNMYSIGL